MNRQIHTTLAYFDAEIHAREVDEQKPGWTRWALIGALGTSAWLLAQELERLPLSWDRLAFFLLSAFVFVHTISSVDRLLTTSSRSRRHVTLFTLDILGYQVRRYSVLEALFYLSLGAIAVCLIYPTPFAFKALFITLCTGQLLANVVVFGLSFTRFPIPTSQKPAHTLILGSAALLLDLFFCWSIVYITLHSYLLPSVHEIRAVALIGVSFWLLRMIVDAKAGNPLVESMREIRRSLFLGEIDERSAQQQFRIVLRGLPIAEYFRDQIAEYISTAKETQQMIVDMRTQIQAVRLQIRRRSARTTRSSFTKQLTSAKADSNKVSRNLANMDKLAANMQIRIGIIQSINPVAASDLTKVADQMRLAFKPITTSFASVQRMVASLQKYAQ